MKLRLNRVERSSRPSDFLSVEAVEVIVRMINLREFVYQREETHENATYFTVEIRTSYRFFQDLCEKIGNFYVRRKDLVC